MNKAPFYQILGNLHGIGSSPFAQVVGHNPHIQGFGLGFVPAQPVITGYAVVPVVGFVDGPFEPRLDPREVSEVFRVPLAFFMDDANGTLRSRERNGVRAELWEYHWEGHRIWGATAKIIREFLRLL